MFVVIITSTLGDILKAFTFTFMASFRAFIKLAFIAFIMAIIKTLLVIKEA